MHLWSNAFFDILIKYTFQYYLSVNFLSNLTYFNNTTIILIKNTLQFKLKLLTVNIKIFL